MSRPVCVDAFCGAGGLSLGLSAAGFDIQLAFDKDPLCIQTLQNAKRHIKHLVLECDIASMLNGGLLKYTGLRQGQLDLLAGGPPCQGFSNQRTIGAEDDIRNNLVIEYGKLIEEVLPKFFLMENVQGISGKRGRRLLDIFCSKMEKLGFFIHIKTLNAQEYGVPQRRRRVIIVGERLDLGKIRFSWPTPSPEKLMTVRDTIGHLPPPPSDHTAHSKFPGHRADKLSQKNQERMRALKQGQGRTELPANLLANCHLQSAEKIGHRNVYGRMSWDEVAPTITARFDSFTRGKFGHPEQNRTISLYEGALLQSFPDDYHFIGTKVEIARQIGNAIPPKLAKAIGKSINAALSAKTDK